MSEADEVTKWRNRAKVWKDTADRLKELNQHLLEQLAEVIDSRNAWQFAAVMQVEADERRIRRKAIEKRFGLDAIDRIKNGMQP